jgi:hypothetical protein
MSRRPVAVALCLAALALAGVAAGCGEEEETEVAEGEPIELADLSYNVGLTRFLNPDDNEDAEYLVGQPPAESGFYYLGVFLTIDNETDEDLASAEEYVVRDTLENEYEPIESESPFALEIGAVVPAEGALPLPDTTVYADGLFPEQFQFVPVVLEQLDKADFLHGRAQAENRARTAAASGASASFSRNWRSAKQVASSDRICR